MSRLGNSPRVGWIVLLFLYFCAIISCDKEVQLPVPEDKLVMILRDVHIAESAVLHLMKSDKDSVLNEYYEQICQIHEVSRADLDSSIVMLKRDPALSYPVYERVLEELEKLDLQQE